MKRILLICLSLFTSFALNAQSDNEIYYFDRSNSTVEFDFKKINDYYERLHLLYNISNDDRFVMTSSDEHGLFYISNNDEIIDRNSFKETFETFYHDCYSDFRMLDKNEISELEGTWRNNVSNMDIVSLMMDIMMRSAPRGNNDSCYKAEPFCTDNGLYTFQAMTGDNHPSESGPAYSCLSSQPCPSWYYMKISTPGAFSIHMMGKDGNTERDIDYCCWGPFDDPVDPCPHNPGPHQNGLTASKVVSCSYSPSYDEHCQIPSSSTTGDYYILIITNYSRARCIITFEKEPGSGPGTTDCSIMPPVMEYSDACYGNTLHLSAHEVSNAQYSWTGPNGFTSTLREPHIDNVTFANSGTYSCTVTIPGQGTSDPMTLDIEILPELHANFIVSDAAPGIPTQFTGTETTIPAGNTNKITSRTWDFGDGSPEVSGANPTHVYTTPGTYNVTYTIVAENATGGTCEDSKTIPVTVECSIMPPVIEYSDACHGSTLHLSAQYVDGVSYSWTGPNGFTSSLREPHIDNVTFANSGTYSCATSISELCSSDPMTLDIEILPELNADFTVAGAVLGLPAQFTGTETTYPAGCTNKITSRTWDFGDGSTTATGTNPTHVYTNPGTYEVTYTIVAENETGWSCEDTKTIPVTVECSIMPPVIEYSDACHGSTLHLSAQYVDGVSYSWTGPNGFTSSLREPHIDNVTFANSGTYSCATSISELCSSDPMTLDIEILPELNADFTVAGAAPGAPTQFTGTETTYPAGYTNKITSRTWDFGDGSTTATGINPTHVYTNPGTYNVTYTIVAENETGWLCEDTKTMPITVTNNLSTVVSSDNSDLCEGESTTLRANVSGGTQNYTYTWTPAQSLNNPNIAAPTATPTETTTYKCVVSDGYDEVEDECTVTVHPKYNASTTVNETSCDPYIIDYYNIQTHQWDQMVFDYSYDGIIDLTTTHGCDSLSIDLHFVKLDQANVPLINDDEDGRKEVMPGSSWMPLQYKFEIGDITGGGVEQGFPVEYNWSITYHVDWTGIDNTGTWILQENGTNEVSLLVLGAGNATINCDVTTACGTTHREIFVYTELYGVDENEGEEYVSIYPNPANTLLHIDFDKSVNSEGISIKIYNAAGSLVDELTTSGSTVERSIQNLSDGLYFIKISGNDLNIVKRLTVVK